MPRADITANGPEPPLEPDEIVVCRGKDREGVSCGAEYTAADLQREPLWSIDCPKSFGPSGLKVRSRARTCLLSTAASFLIRGGRGGRVAR